MDSTYVTQSRSGLHDLWPQLATAGANADATLTLGMYQSADITNPESPEEGWESPVIEHFYGKWTSACRHLRLPDSTRTDAAVRLAGASTWNIVRDVTRRPTRNPGTPVSLPYEAQALARIISIMHAIFKGLESALEASIVGAPCGYLLQEGERNVLLPERQSWPVSRASHVQSAADKGETCLRLASGQWDDGHWDVE